MSLCPHGYTAFWDCPTCPEPMGTAPDLEPLRPDVEQCSRCGANTAFELVGGASQSACCAAPAVNVEPPAWMEDR